VLSALTSPTTVGGEGVTQCSRCGDCCENIWTDWTRASLNYELALYPPSAPPDYSLNARARNTLFTNKHWHNIDGDPHRWTCDAFDPVSRMCTAQENKPPVCVGYPWYEGTDGEREPSAETLRRSPRCSFWADLPTQTAPAAVAVELGASHV